MQKTTVKMNTWIIIEDILRKEGIAKQHLNSYNEFIERGVQSIVDEMLPPTAERRAERRRQRQT